MPEPRPAPSCCPIRQPCPGPRSWRSARSASSPVPGTMSLQLFLLCFHLRLRCFLGVQCGSGGACGWGQHPPWVQGPRMMRPCLSQAMLSPLEASQGVELDVFPPTSPMGPEEAPGWGTAACSLALVAPSLASAVGVMALLLLPFSVWGLISLPFCPSAPSPLPTSLVRPGDCVGSPYTRGWVSLNRVLHTPQRAPGCLLCHIC